MPDPVPTSTLVHYSPLLTAILVLPVFASVVTLIWNVRLGKRTYLPTAVGSALAFVLAVVNFYHVMTDEHHLTQTAKHVWFSAGNFVVTLGLAADPITALMLLAITFVGTCVIVYSAGYMDHDPGQVRYFAIIGLFISSMCGLVLSTNMLMMYAFWEGVGLCSYLLVGFWYYKPSAALAARKAFLVTRLGDSALIVGLFLLWTHCGYSLEFSEVFDRAKTADPAIITLATLLIAVGAFGKSAQFPFHVWLPDAMEGPTPVSALIHAATMVTAGVYLLARCADLLVLVPTAQLVVAIIGAFTALIAAFIALTQTDLKRVLAYSTVSQLGYMFLALGCANGDLKSVAVAAALFHLFTHAFFKALLFLSAGSVMHAMGDIIDMRRFGGLSKLLPWTHFAFLFGALALAGIPPFAGFWSKDQILEVLYLRGQAPGGEVYYVLLGVAVLTAGMTAFYTFRAYFLAFRGELVVPPEAGDHAHESPPTMIRPLVLLAVLSLVIGAICAPLWGDYIATLDHGHAHAKHPHETNWPLIIVGLSAAGVGVLFAFIFYGRSRATAEKMVQNPVFGLGYQFSLHQLFFDDLYKLIIVQPLELLAQILDQMDTVIDQLALAIASIPRGLASLIRPVHNGLVQFYAVAMMLGLTVFLGLIALWR
jgi:NADH-quinone oxidoreductase subunit L